MDHKSLRNVISSKIKNVFVSALKYISRHILAGQGGVLHLYRVSRDGFNPHAKLCSYDIFQNENIYGIVPKNNNYLLLFGGKKVSVWTGENFMNLNEHNSWIAEDWIFDGVWCEDNTVILLTAHNVLLHYEFTSSIIKVLATTWCIERSILYSGKIIGSKWQDIVVLAGTVYQEVIIWSTCSNCVDNDVPVLHRLKGHKGVIFCIHYNPASKCIASTSDDRTVRVWSVKFPDSTDLVDKWSYAEIKLSFTAFGHTARVWRCLFAPQDRLVTVGEDSQICLWDMKGNLLNRWEHNGEIWALDYYDESIVFGGNGIVIRSLSSVPECHSVYSSNGLGAPKCVILNSFGRPVASTDKGCLVKVNHSIIDSVIDERFLSYCVLSCSPCRKFVALGGIKGDVLIFRVDGSNFLKSDETNFGAGRVYSLTWAKNETLVACCENGLLSVADIDTEEGAFNINSLRKFILPPSKERWITCSFFTEYFFICGDRMGSVHLYSLTAESQDPVHSHIKLHGLKGVSDIKYIDGIFYSTGRDGSLREFNLIANKICLNSTLKLPMDWAAGIIDSKIYGLLIAGFHDVNFILWSVNERITLLALVCGGGHRSFDYFIDETKGNLILTFIRMKDVKYLHCTLTKVAHQTVIPAYHTKSINSACLLLTSDMGSVVLTGGEDNSLRLCKFEGACWRAGTTYIRHISAIRAVKSVENIVVSAGARAQIIVWKAHESSNGELHLREVQSHMIRDESVHKRSWRNVVPLIDPETRYMDLEVVMLHENQFMIFAGCSDGMLRIFEYDNAAEILTLKSSMDCGQGCLLKLLFFKWLDKGVVITAGTTGNVGFWYSPFDTQPSKFHPLHPLGINAIDLILVRNNVILGTGGDDSSVVLTVFSLNKSKHESVIFSLTERVHSCQVSGIKITSKYIISVSLDQKLCLFHWIFDGNYLKTSLLSWFMTSVPDIHGILTWEFDKKKDLSILVYGIGFQLLHFNCC